MILPTAVLPVKFTLWTAGCLIIASVTSEADVLGQHMKFSTPSGKPALLLKA